MGSAPRAPAPKSPEIKIGDMVLDRYRVVEQIGSGGHSVVFKGTDERLSRPVCIKVFSGLGGQSGVGRTSYEHFVQEAFALSRLTHPNTLRIYDFGHLGPTGTPTKDPGGMPLQVCEYMNGGTLSQIIREQGKQSLEETVRIVSAMCAALSEAHALGIVHRDIKPQNILFGSVGTNRLPKLADFGIAKWSADTEQDREQRAEDTAIVAGQKLAMYSPSWAAPEQLAGQPVSPATDIYSLAVVAIYMISGKAIFADEDVYAGYKKRRHADELVKSELAPFNVPKAMVDVLSRALAFDPKKRVPRVDELASELQSSIEPSTEEITRLPPPPQAAPTQPGRPRKTQPQHGLTPPPEPVYPRVHPQDAHGYAQASPRAPQPAPSAPPPNVPPGAAHPASAYPQASSYSEHVPPQAPPSTRPQPAPQASMYPSASAYPQASQYAQEPQTPTVPVNAVTPPTPTPTVKPGNLRPDPPAVAPHVAPTPPVIPANADPTPQTFHAPTAQAWMSAVAAPSGPARRLPLADIPHPVGDRRVHFVMVGNGIADLVGLHGTKVRVSILPNATGARVVHVKGLTCFIAHLNGRPSPAVQITQSSDLALVTPRAQEIGHLRVAQGTLDGAANVFGIGSERVAVGLDDCADPILFDFGPGSDAYFVYTQGRTVPKPGRRGG